MATQVSYRARWARSLVREKLSAEINKLQGLQHHDGPMGYGHQLPLLGSTPVSPKYLPPENSWASYEDGSPKQGSLPQRSKVCIVGAGVSGLYIAMILDDLAIPGLSYQVLEASARVGGRLYTHRFSDALHDYYDIGAMRFPKIKIMDRTFDLFKRLKVNQIPYFYDYGSVRTPSMYNDIVSIKGDQPPPDNHT